MMDRNEAILVLIETAEWFLGERHDLHGTEEAVRIRDAIEAAR